MGGACFILAAVSQSVAYQTPRHITHVYQNKYAHAKPRSISTIKMIYAALKWKANIQAIWGEMRVL